jgi:type I restriction enzyme R subunit
VDVPVEGLHSANFTVLAEHDEQLVRLAALAERYFAEDPNTSLIKLRQFSELLAQQVAARYGLLTTPDEPRTCYDASSSMPASARR